MFWLFPPDKVLIISPGTWLEAVEKRNSFNGQLIHEYDHEMFFPGNVSGTSWEAKFI